MLRQGMSSSGVMASVVLSGLLAGTTAQADHRHAPEPQIRFGIDFNWGGYGPVYVAPPPVAYYPPYYAPPRFLPPGYAYNRGYDRGYDDGYWRAKWRGNGHDRHRHRRHRHDDD